MSSGRALRGNHKLANEKRMIEIEILKKQEVID